MNRVQVIEEVHRIYKEKETILYKEYTDKKIKRKIFEKKKKGLYSDFTNNKYFKLEYGSIWSSWNNTIEKYDKDEQWHQFARGCIHIDELRYMTAKAFRLFREFDVPRDTNFQLEFGDHVTNFPDEVSKLIWMEKDFSDYVRILKDAKLKLSFNTEERKTDERRIRGRINWKETLRKSPGRQPTSFETTWRKKTFVTPENILLVTCAVWLNRQAKFLLAQSKSDILSVEGRVLAEIILKTAKICRTFPFHDVVDEALKKSKHLPSSRAILQLEKKIKKRIGSKLIDNKAYVKLLKWLEDFKKKSTLSLEDLPQESLVLLAMHNIDTLYEFWIYLEILAHFSKKSVSKIIPTTLGNSKVFDYFETNIDGRTAKFHFNKQFKPTDSLAWTTTSEPDITVTVDGKFVGVFDAKNVLNNKMAGNTKAEKTRTMLGYMMNLMAPMGALFFPHWSNRFEPQEKGVLGFSMPVSASWIQMKPAPDAESEKINSDSLGFLEEELSKFVALV